MKPRVVESAPIAVALLLLLQIPSSGQGLPTAEDPVQHFSRAKQLAEQGKLAGAVSEYHVGLRLDPKSAAAYNNLGAIYFQEKKFRDAILWRSLLGCGTGVCETWPITGSSGISA